MAHEPMFDPDDPLLARIREIALALPEAAEKVSHGRPAFHTVKVFVYYGGSIKVDGSWEQHPQSVLLYADLLGQTQLRSRPDSFIPGYLGGSGWTGLDLGPATDYNEIADLIEESYRLTAPKRLLRALDD